MYPFIFISDCVRWIIYTGNRIKIHPESSVSKKPRPTNLNAKWKKQLSGYSPVPIDESEINPMFH